MNPPGDALDWQTLAATMFQQSPIPTSIGDRDGFMLAGNQAWDDYWNASAAEAIQRRYNPLQDPTLEAVRPAFIAALEGQTSYIPPFFFDPAQAGMPGKARWVSIVIFPLFDAHGATSHFVVQNIDVTEIKQAEQELVREIELQQKVIEELATPLLQINQETLVMPLVGAIDTRRASDVLRTLLEGVSDSSASRVILDITGVPVVDTQVAMVLVQAARAVNLLGAQVILTGIRPEIAQTLVGLGVDLHGIITMGSLQAGIDWRG